MTSRLLALTITAAVALGVAGSASAGDTTYTYGVNGTKRTCTLTRGAKCVGAKLRGKVKHHGDLRNANLFGAMPLTTFWRNTTCPNGTVTSTPCPPTSST